MSPSCSFTFRDLFYLSPHSKEIAEFVQAKGIDIAFAKVEMLRWSYRENFEFDCRAQVKLLNRKCPRRFYNALIQHGIYKSTSNSS